MKRITLTQMEDYPVWLKPDSQCHFVDHIKLCQSHKKSLFQYISTETKFHPGPEVYITWPQRVNVEDLRDDRESGYASGSPRLLHGMSGVFLHLDITAPYVCDMYT